jgi:hypothetical protein
MTESKAQLKRRRALLRRAIAENLKASSEAQQRAMQQARELAVIDEAIQQPRSTE